MPFQLNLKSAEETRVQITKQQQKYIEKLYTDLAKKIEKEAQKAPKTATDYLRREFLNDLRESVDKELTEIRHLIQSKVEDSMEKTAESVVESNREFLKEFDLPSRMALAHIPPDIVREVATGQLYEGNWSLARQLWKQEKHTQSDINKVIAEGIAANKSAYDIAKDLEKYVDPKARKEWDWSKVYPGTAKKVDYNAQRLARTMVSHAYERAFVESTKDNPFVTEYEWRASGTRSCPLCMDRDGKRFPKDDLPLDHPNGMCTFIAVIPDNYDEIANRLADWANGVEDVALDKYAEKLYGKEWNAQIVGNKYKYSTANIEKPIRPIRSDFDNSEDYYAARSVYRSEMETYTQAIDRSVEQAKNISRFSSVDEVVSWAKTNGVHLESGLFDSIDLRAMNETSIALDDMFKRFPEAKSYNFEYFDGSLQQKRFSIGIDNDGLLSANGGLRFNPKYFSNFGDGLREAFEQQTDGTIVRGDGTFSSLIRHEYGHNVDSYIKSKISDEFHQNVDDWHKNFSTFDEYKAARSAYWEKFDTYRMELKSLAGLSGSSSYSNTNELELFAEGFAAYTSGEKTEFAKGFSEFLQRWY